jgi:hypothetical protein
MPAKPRATGAGFLSQSVREEGPAQWRLRGTYVGEYPLRASSRTLSGRILSTEPGELAPSADTSVTLCAPTWAAEVDLTGFQAPRGQEVTTPTWSPSPTIRSGAVGARAQRRRQDRRRRS